jgi:hypothetical protein
LPAEVRSREVVFEGNLITVRRDVVAVPDDNEAGRRVAARIGAGLRSDSTASDLGVANVGAERVKGFETRSSVWF